MEVRVMSSITHVAEELADELDEDVNEVCSSLENLIVYGVPMDEAKAAIRRKYE